MKHLYPHENDGIKFSLMFLGGDIVKYYGSFMHSQNAISIVSFPIFHIFFDCIRVEFSWRKQVKKGKNEFLI